MDFLSPAFLYTGISFIIIAMIMLYLGWIPKKKLLAKSYDSSQEETLNVAKAGGRNDNYPATVKVIGLSNKTFMFGKTLVNANEYKKFIVCGDSMNPFDIRSGSGLLVSVYDKNREVNFQKAETLIFEMETKEGKKEYKMRKYLSNVNLSKDTDEIYDEQKNIYSKLTEEKEKNQFIYKLGLAKKRFPNEIVSLSLTYKDNKLDYSFHALYELYGKVEYMIPREYIKIQNEKSGGEESKSFFS
jgi:hypothetical protein